HGKQKDKYFYIRYKLNRKDKEEGLGWASEGWSEKKAGEILFKLKESSKTGEGARTLAEKREQAQKQKEEEEAKTKEEESKIITFSQVYEMYIPAQKTKKDPKTCRNEIGYYENWFKETIGSKPLDTIKTDDIQIIIDKALSSNKKPATARLLKAFVRQVLNFAKSRELYTKDNVAEKVTIPKFDNRRTRFLSAEEARKLLEVLKERNKQVHDMTVFSMYSGARLGEVFSLCWENINFKTKFITLFDTKNNNKTRHIPLTKETEKLLKDLKKPNSNGLVFKTEEGEKFKNLPKVFFRVINELGFNEGITDSRQEVVFHTLRHSYASWLMMEGADLFVVKELMGHSTTIMTERYSHLSPEHLKKTASLLDKYTIE
ncbi:MAG: site-specific integrase, partial [Holosporaceae bacterium]|nr:site-specific integrase [Holosporaceae bacterium]